MRLDFVRDVVMCVSLMSVAGCVSMTASKDFDFSGSRAGLACRSDLGAYSLPRKLISVSIKTETSDVENYGLEVDEGDYVADPKQVYCLDFLASSVADERVGVKRNNTNSLLLERVYTKSIDKTLENAKKLIEAGADAIAFGQAKKYGRDATIGSGVAGQNTLRKFDFDPFVMADLRKVNGALRQFGYCIYLDHSVDALVPAWSQHACDGGGEWNALKGGNADMTAPDYADIVDRRPISDELREEGIFYRPELTHLLVIMKQDQPGLEEAPWYRAGSMRLTMPNGAPPFLLRVERSVFVDAETDVKFKSGVMQSVAVDKKSELYALSDFAVEVVQVVQKIPTVTLAVVSNSVDNELALIAANEQLINTMQEYNHARGINVANRALTLDTNDMILQGYAPVVRSAAEPDAMSTCLNDPAHRNVPNPAATCREILQRNL
ncbi:hypothetical protein [Hyphomicrobium sp.]|uniref:hypothetical protein n=1 Tax=Hyphomicrobium sp. TaxID=82 RepID=UPI0025C34CE7|nr:hypothetical protein [Hyphomicrobium sp.]MCC7250507.1 hypothetical protein [Hyphomicrobium sp.]